MTEKQRDIFYEVKARKDLPSLYRSLHLVGDDPVKADIQDTLKELLTPDAYEIVQAVFAINTDDNLMMELEEKEFYDQEEE
jgi:hypothetical protein